MPFTSVLRSHVFRHLPTSVSLPLAATPLALPPPLFLHLFHVIVLFISLVSLTLFIFSCCFPSPRLEMQLPSSFRLLPSSLVSMCNCIRVRFLCFCFFFFPLHIPLNNVPTTHLLAPWRLAWVYPSVVLFEGSSAFRHLLKMDHTGEGATLAWWVRGSVGRKGAWGDRLTVWGDKLTVCRGRLTVWEGRSYMKKQVVRREVVCEEGCCALRCRPCVERQSEVLGSVEGEIEEGIELTYVSSTLMHLDIYVSHSYSTLIDSPTHKFTPHTVLQIDRKTDRQTCTGRHKAPHDCTSSWYVWVYEDVPESQHSHSSA